MSFASFAYQQNHDVIKLSQQLINRLYSQVPATLLPYLDSNIVWIDTTRGRSLFSYYQVQELFSRSPAGNPLTVLHMQYHNYAMPSGPIIISGKYLATKKTAERLHVGHTYHVTMLWSPEQQQPRLMHIHISAALPRSAAGEPLHFHGSHAETYQLFPDDIVYIEAANVNCMVYGISNQFSACQSISQVEQLLSKHFLRVHRSFIVNCHYVTRVYRYAIELANQMTVPVPEKKYMGVLCAIENKHTNEVTYDI